jgi:hypothetical protein
VDIHAVDGAKDRRHGEEEQKDEDSFLVTSSCATR